MVISCLICKLSSHYRGICWWYSRFGIDSSPSSGVHCLLIKWWPTEFCIMQGCATLWTSRQRIVDLSGCWSGYWPRHQEDTTDDGRGGRCTMTLAAFSFLGRGVLPVLLTLTTIVREATPIICDPSLIGKTLLWLDRVEQKNNFNKPALMSRDIHKKIRKTQKYFF